MSKLDHNKYRQKRNNSKKDSKIKPQQKIRKVI